jgi:hypothetical protein
METLERTYIMPSKLAFFFNLGKDKSSRSIFCKDRVDTYNDKEIREIEHAFNTYLNVTGPGQYNLPNTTYGK